MPTSIFWGFSAHGHTNPSLPLVAELVRRGERIYYYSHEEFQLAIERTGATFREYGVDFPLLHILTGPQDPARTTYGLAQTSQWVLEQALPSGDHATIRALWSSRMLTIIYTSKLFQPFADSFDPQRYAFVGPALMPRPEAPAFPFEALEKEKPLI
jgi:UDP:flavonoid glycosyltransferase YjiC (YdhE family)